MVSEEFKNEFFSILDFDAEAVGRQSARPKKGQTLSNDEVEFVNDELKLFARGVPRTEFEMKEARDLVNAVRALYRVDRRDKEQKGELILTPRNYELWLSDFSSFRLLDRTEVEFVPADTAAVEKSGVKILGLEWN